MEQLLRHFLLVTILSIGAFAALGDNIFSPAQSCLTLQMIKTSSNEEKKEPEKGQRAPGLLIECTISISQGIQLNSSVDVSDILAYEIWDAEGESCIASFCDEAGFINFLFSLSGEFQIRFTTPDYNLVGFIQI